MKNNKQTFQPSVNTNDDQQYLDFTRSDEASANDDSFMVSSTYDRLELLAPIDLGDRVLTELALAELTIQQYRDSIRWVGANKTWSIFDKETGLWSLGQSEQIFNMIVSILKALRLAESEKVKKSGALNNSVIRQIEKAERSNFLSGVERLMQIDPTIYIQPSEFDSDPYLVGLHGKQCLDLRTVTVRSITSIDYLTKSLATRFDPEAKCELWERSIKEWTCNDKELDGFLNVWSGYSLSGLTSFQKFLFLHGDGLNGKSVFLKIMTTLFGPYWINLRSESLMQQNRGVNASPDIAKLVGVRLVTSSELQEGSCFDENLIKQLTGGDTITARHLYAKEFDFTPCFKLLIAGNHKPVVKGTDFGFWRRFLLVPFDAKIQKPDGQLTEKLLQELPGILNWCIAGWNEYENNNRIIAIPKVITDASDEYKDDMDLMQQWKNECVESSIGDVIKAIQVYESYKNWAKNYGYHPMTFAAFSRKTANFLGKTVRKSSGMHYEHIRVNNLTMWQ